jgi:hypothetical protein
MKSAVIAAIALAGVTILPPSVASQRIGIYPNPGGFTEDFVPTPGVPFTLYVVLTNDYGNDKWSGINFSVSMPDEPNLLLSFGVYAPFLAIGDVFNGIDVQFGGCVTPPIVIGSFSMIPIGPLVGCGEMRVLAHPAVGEIQTFDCNGVAHAAHSGDCLYLGDQYACNTPPPATDPFPADGATGVDLDVGLSWSSVRTPACPTGHPGVYFDWIYFGTDPDPPLIHTNGYPPQDPGNLQPGTTYYWRVEQHESPYPVGTSPVWSFTTAAPVGVKPSTWGAIKALYR